MSEFAGCMGTPPRCAKCGLPKSRHYKVRLHRSDPDHKFVAKSWKA